MAEHTWEERGDDAVCIKCGYETTLLNLGLREQYRRDSIPECPIADKAPAKKKTSAKK